MPAHGDRPGDRGPRPAQVLRRGRGGPRHRLPASRAARSTACSGPTAPARRAPSRSSRATASAAPAASACSATTRRRARASCAGASASCCRAAASTARCASRRCSRHFAGFYPHPRDVDEVIALVGLGEKRDERARTLSGGQRRRLDLALALIGDPELIFLDEPTTGFDPAARRTAWQTIRSLQGPRQDRAADDALPRRGPGARRPRRDHQGRPDPRRGLARASSASAAAPATASPTCATGSR